MPRILALAALVAAAAALASIVAGGAPALLTEPAAEVRAAGPAVAYPLLDRDGGLQDRAVVQRAVRRAVLRERRRNEEAARRDRVAEVRRAVARTRAAMGDEVRAYRRQLSALRPGAARRRR